MSPETRERFEAVEAVRFGSERAYPDASGRPCVEAKCCLNCILF